MNRSIPVSFAVIWVFFALAACKAAAPTEPPPNTQATIDAAVAATNAAQVANQAAIDAAVQATGTAQAINQAAIETAVEATNTAQGAGQETVAEQPVQATPTIPPTPISTEQYVTMTEEELAALIDQTVAEAMAAAEQSSTATTAATADNTVTADEVQTVEVYLTGAEAAVALAEELLYIYYDLYSDLATETADTLAEINQSLQYLTAYGDELNATLTEINTLLEQEYELTEETIAELEAAAQEISAKAANLQEQTLVWQDIRQTQVEDRIAMALAIPPNQIAADPQEAIKSAFSFIEAGNQAIGDGRISPEELTNLAQLGANASASLNAQSIPQLQRLSGSISDITGQIARGDVTQAQAALTTFGNSLNAVPNISNLSLLEKPSLPEKPSLSGKSSFRN